MEKAKVQQGVELSEDELSVINEKFHYQPGKPYHFILTQGWVYVGYFVRMESPVEIRLAHANYYRNAGNQTHAALSQGGANSQTTWEYMGEVLVNKMQVLVSSHYNGKVPHGRIA